MRLRYIFKLLVRSRSLGFTLRAAQQSRSQSFAKLHWRGHDLFYRPGTTDARVLFQILLRTGKKAEYSLPPALNPEVILDIGSHIGASILYFRELFPRARIFGFEPHPETFKLLQLNVAKLDSVSVFNYGLGSRNTTISVPFESGDFSGFSVAPT